MSARKNTRSIAFRIDVPTEKCKGGEAPVVLVAPGKVETLSGYPSQPRTRIRFTNGESAMVAYPLEDVAARIGWSGGEHAKEVAQGAEE